MDRRGFLSRITLPALVGALAGCVDFGNGGVGGTTVVIPDGIESVDCPAESMQTDEDRSTIESPGDASDAALKSVVSAIEAEYIRDRETPTEIKSVESEPGAMNRKSESGTVRVDVTSTIIKQGDLDDEKWVGATPAYAAYLLHDSRLYRARLGRKPGDSTMSVDPHRWIELEC